MDCQSNGPTVSVILPTYNRAHLLGRAIRSALDQTYEDFELIVVDDESTDATEQVVTGFDDQRIRYLRHEETRGAAAARNTGIKQARGEYVAFLDSDGQWLPQKLEKQMKVFGEASSEVGVVYTDSWAIYEDGRKEYGRSPRIMPEDGLVYDQAIDYRVSGINTQAAVIRRECFARAGMFDERFPRYVDLELFIRLSRHFHFYHLAEPLLNHYDAVPGISSDAGLLVEARKLILEKYHDDIEKSRRSLATHLYGIGTVLCQNGQIDEGRHYLLAAVRTYPLSIRHLASALVWLFGEGTYNKASRLRRTIGVVGGSIRYRLGLRARHPHR